MAACRNGASGTRTRVAGRINKNRRQIEPLVQVRGQGLHAECFGLVVAAEENIESEFAGHVPGTVFGLTGNEEVYALAFQFAVKVGVGG
jgi:hypothetical protein